METRTAKKVRDRRALRYLGIMEQAGNSIRQ